MSYSLECYTLDWKDLAAVMGRGDLALYQEVRSNAANSGILSAESAIESLLLGAPGKALAAVGPERSAEPRLAADDIALAMVAIVRTIGQAAGELPHSSSAGAMFRDEFLRDSALTVFPAANFELLIERPLFGLRRADYPYWGGLKKAEVAAALGELTEDDLPEWADEDQAEWLFRLYEILAAAKSLNKDVVSLYL